MRRHILLSLLLLSTLVLSISALAGGRGASDNSYIGRSRHELQRCLQAATEPGYDLTASVSTVGSCFAGGFLTEVTWAKSLRCRRAPCPAAPTVLVGSVLFGCDGEVVSATCQADVCTSDADCAPDGWCRQQDAGGFACAPYAQEGDSCGGFTTPGTQEQCDPSLLCVYSDPTFDMPGVCATCEYEGQPYFEGESFPAADGCNSCTCNAGGLVACTLRLCAPR